MIAAVTVGGFWGDEYKKLTVKWLPHCIREMEAGGAGEEYLNLVATAEKLAGKEPSVKFKGCKWSDAYPYNIVEAASLALEIDPAGDAEWKAAQDFLRAKIEEWIPTFLAAQEPCGYIHSYHELNGYPHFNKEADHEFYVMGYFIEMGIAHSRMTGGKDRRLLDAAIRCADHLCDTFGPAPKRTWMNGHPGLEMALQRLSDATGDRKYSDLARFFVLNQCSQADHRRGYDQSDIPAGEMKNATGHAVRANYFYTAMARIPETEAAAKRLWESVIDRKMYLTGGVGSDYKGEAYGRDYSLPQMAYAESCAGCGLAFFARNMARFDRERAEAVYERVLYNNILGAISRDGENFWYQNPLSSNKLRTPWHGCPCCVGNVPRTLFALKDNLYRIDGDTLYLDHYMAFENGEFKMTTDYPFDGKVKVELKNPAVKKIVVRFPWRDESRLYTATPELEHGYREVGNEFVLPLVEQKIMADERVEACRGLVAYQTGPIVWSWETQDTVAPAVKVANFDRLNTPGYARVWIPSIEKSAIRRIDGLSFCP